MFFFVLAIATVGILWWSLATWVRRAERAQRRELHEIELNVLVAVAREDNSSSLRSQVERCATRAAATALLDKLNVGGLLVSVALVSALWCAWL
jgi:hypothetical protein